MSRNNINLSEAISTFLELADTEFTYDGRAGQVPIVNETETGLTFGYPNSGFVRTGSIDFRQSGDLNRIIFNVQYRLTKIGRLCCLDILSPATSIQNLQGGNFLNGNLNLEPELRPSGYHVWSCSLVADNEDQFTHPEHRFAYYAQENNFRFRNSTRSDGLWDNPRTFNVFGFSVSWICDDDSVPSP